MVKKGTKTSGTKTKTVYRYRSAPRKRARRTNTGVKDIPAAAATVALAVVNVNAVEDFIGRSKMYGFKSAGQIYQRARKNVLSNEQLAKDALAIAGGMIGGELFKSFAPNFIKRPVAKIAKKVPKVF